ncbi:MAG: GNAT family N-acetyltransferase [Bdellovibrio sp.]
MSLSYEVKRISAADTLPLRQKVMKPFLTQGQCVNAGDDLATTLHFGLFHENQLITIASFMLESHPDFFAGYPYRLRGMATDQAFQGHGFGQKIVRFAMDYLQQQRCDLIWCNAREKAFPFYESLGFLYQGDFFDIPQIGPHKVMYHRIISRR